MMTPRIERLKQRLINARPEVDAQRALLVTQAYQETENQAPEIKRARAMCPEKTRKIIKEAVDGGLFFHYYLNRSIGPINSDYETVLKIGLSGIHSRIWMNWPAGPPDGTAALSPHGSIQI